MIEHLTPYKPCILIIKGQKCRWITNVCKDPTKVQQSSSAPQTREQLIKSRADYMRDKVTGPPCATEQCSVERLIAWGLVGIYKVVEDE